MTIELGDEAKIRILNSEDLFAIMKEILMREQKIDQDREHFWVIGLASNNRMLFVELITLGTVDKALVEPMEVYSLALQKRAVRIMLVHNHPSGDVDPSEADKDVTDRLIQVGLILNTPVLDHLIITPTNYLSFSDAGLLAELSRSLKYVPPYKQVEAIKKMAEELGLMKGEKIGKAIGKKQGMESKSNEIARKMKAMGLADDVIAGATGLPLEKIKAIEI